MPFEQGWLKIPSIIDGVALISIIDGVALISCLKLDMLL